MTITYVNRKNQIYYLHQGITKTEKPKYFFSMKNEGPLVDNIPEGFEIYENPDARVYLRRIRPKIITDAELAIVNQGVQQFSKLKDYLTDVKKNALIVLTPDQDIEILSELLDRVPATSGQDVKSLLAQSVTYSPYLQFVLIDEEKRIFITQRYCFLGSIDDWIEIGKPDTLPNLVKTYVKHLGQDSYYELY